MRISSRKAFAPSCASPVPLVRETEPPAGHFENPIDRHPSRKLGISRSQFYCKAVEAFLKAHRNHGIKDALDAVYGAEDSWLDPVLAAMQDASIQPEDW
jgi:hypothetical protein